MLVQRKRSAQALQSIMAIFLADVEYLNTSPSCPRLNIWNVKFARLDIYGWPNIKDWTDFDTILETG